MSRIDGRKPNASGQITTAGCAPLAGWMNAASHVPSGVLISTFVSVTCCAETSAPAAAANPAATVDFTKPLRVMSSFMIGSPRYQLTALGYQPADSDLTDDS